MPVPGHPSALISYQKLCVLETNHIGLVQEVVGDAVVNLNVAALLNGVDLEGTRVLERPAWFRSTLTHLLGAPRP